jgi:hypothetical protein
MGQMGCPETSVLNQPTLRNIPEDVSIQVNRSGSLRSELVVVLRNVTNAPKNVTAVTRGRQDTR